MIDPQSKRKIRGLFYSTLWYISILIGFYYLYAPLLPLVIFQRKLYRKSTDFLFAAWSSFNVSLLEICMGCRTVMTGDQIRPEENSLIILNHRTRLDWNFLCSGLLHGTYPPAHNAKLVLKDEIKKIPGVGWMMQMSRFIYICRKWNKDETRLGQLLTYLGKYSSSDPYQMVIFPEGTNLTQETQKKSAKYGEENNLKPLKNLLHPRTTGFTYMVKQMTENGGLSSVYDMTIAYPDEMPETEQELFEGKFPQEVHFHIKRYPISTLPTTYIGLEKWLQELWREKDQTLENFYKEKIPFPISSNRQSVQQPIWPLQYISLIAWIALVMKILQILFLTWAPWHWFWIILVTSLMSVISHHTEGLQSIEVQLDNGISWWQIAKNIINLLKGKQD